MAFAELLKQYSEEAARVEADRRTKKKLRPVEGHPFWPHEVVRDTIIFCVFTAACFFLSAFAPYYLEEPANSASQPPVILPDWYLLWAYGALKITEDLTILGRPIPTPFLDAGYNFVASPSEWGPVNAKLLGLVFNGVPVLPIILVPFLSRGKNQRPVEQPVWAAGGLAWCAYVFMLSVYSIDTVVNRDFPAFGKDYTGWTFFYWLKTHGFMPVFQWMYDSGVILVDPHGNLDMRAFFTMFRFDLLAWLTHLLPILFFILAYVPLWIAKKKHGYEAKLNASYYRVR